MGETGGMVFKGFSEARGHRRRQVAGISQAELSPQKGLYRALVVLVVLVLPGRKIKKI